MTGPAERARAAFLSHFSEEPHFLVRAPGRVNLIGEHTDYNDGFVLPCAIDRDTVVAIAPESGNCLSVIAADFGNETEHFALDAPFARSTQGWSDYIRGIACALHEGGARLVGARLAIAGDVPLGSGLSSSASLEIAVARALTELAGSVPSPTTLAQIAQRAENEFVGCACGIMDQLIATRGQAGHALLIDCRSLACTPVAMPADLRLVIAHSGVRHAHADGEYNDRRAQCDAAAKHYGVAALRDLSAADLEARRGDLNDVIYRRARHVVTENERTQAAALALQANDLGSLGLLMNQSHMSMRDDFEITVPAIDRLAKIMTDSLSGEGGARMTGGGFGGCVIALTSAHRVDAVTAAINSDYRSPDGAMADIFVARASEGASRLP
ncbi:MAG: galactokinase [Sphingomonadaceae bacterium]